MMKLDEIRKAYEDLSGSLSSVVRQINFAGIAIVWIFVGKETETPYLNIFIMLVHFLLYP